MLFCFLTCVASVSQGSYGSWKSWKVLDFTLAFSRTGKSWKMTTGPEKSWRSVLRVYCFDHMVFTVSIACGMACKAYSKNKVIVDVATG